MKFMKWDKDGGPDSTVDALYVVEIKPLFSIVLLRFGNGSREAYHSHAFNCWSWVLNGRLIERHMNGRTNALPMTPLQRIFGFGTYRDTFHKVTSIGTTWVFSLRGPWLPNWMEYLETERRMRTLKQGRVETEGMV